MSIKTLHLTNSWHPRSGGIRTFYLALLDSANRAGDQMHLLVPASEDRMEQIGAYAVIHHLKCPLAPGSGSYRMIYPHEYLLPNGRVNRILREYRPDVVEFADKYTLNYLGGLLRIGKLPGINFRPVVTGLSCERLSDSVNNYTCSGSVSRWFASLYLRWLYFPLADHHIAVSGFVASELEAVSAGHKVERGVWLGPMGVDYNTFASITRDTTFRAEIQDKAGGGEATRLLIYAGRLAREKNIPLLIHTMTELRLRPCAPDARLLIVGDGDLRAELETLARTVAPGRVLFLGHQGKLELARLFAACDVFVHANPREPFGIGPLEAMAAALPLVAPDSGGVLNYANAANAWLAAPNPKAFSDAIEQLWSNHGDRESRVERAKATAQAHDWPGACARYLNIYDEIYRISNKLDCTAQGPLFRSTRGRAGQTIRNSPV